METVILSPLLECEDSREKLSLLQNKRGEQIVKAVTVSQIKGLSARRLMIWPVVGDAKTQLPRMKELRLGELLC